MPRIPLTGGPYQARNIIASAQQCINLYPESNPGDSQAPVPVTHYQRPGLRQLVTPPPLVAQVRGTYTTSTGDLYVVIATEVYFVDATLVFNVIGNIPDLPSKISMADNGLAIILVDGTATGYAIDLVARTFAPITDPNFLGADRVDYIDTFFILNDPASRKFYISLSNVTYAMLTATNNAFNSLDVVAKTGAADPVVTVICVHREAWILGSKTSEVWYDAGTPDFALGAVPGAFIEHGCAAKYSVAKHDLSVFWLSQDKDGQGIVIKGTGYAVERISTHAIEALIQTYTTIKDAIGFCYQQFGHIFYILTFPTADVSWAYEVQTGQWHQLAWTDNNGVFHRHRANCYASAYGMNIVGDWQNGAIYALDPSRFDDNGAPIVFLRDFPHIIADGRRITVKSFIADMQVGTASLLNPPMVSLQTSIDRGATFGNAVMQSMGAPGQYLTSVKWNRPSGQGRDIVFRLSWSNAMLTALNGAFVEIEEHGT
jgi:hypothetical protein